MYNLDFSRMTLLERSDLLVHDKIPSVTDFRLHTHQSDLSQLPQTLTNCDFFCLKRLYGNTQERQQKTLRCLFSLYDRGSLILNKPTSFHHFLPDWRATICDWWNTELVQVYFIRSDQQGATPDVFSATWFHDSPSSLSFYPSVHTHTHTPQYLPVPRLTRRPGHRHVHGALVETASVTVTRRCRHQQDGQKLNSSL